jgi:hypothetical protein
MNKLGWFFNGSIFGLLLSLTFFGIENSFTNDFIFPYIFGTLAFGLNFYFFSDDGSFDKKDKNGNIK